MSQTFVFANRSSLSLRLFSYHLVRLILHPPDSIVNESGRYSLLRQNRLYTALALGLMTKVNALHFYNK